MLLSPDLLSRIAEALADDDPDASLARAVSLLAEIGIVPHERLEACPWLEIRYRDRTLALATVGDPIDKQTCDLLAQLLRSGLARADEHADLRKVQERMEMISDAAFEGLMVHVDGVAIYTNQRITEMTGYEPSELAALNILEECVVPEDRAGIRHRLANRIEGVYVVTAMRKDGSRFRAELHAKQGRLGHRPIRVVAVRDVTERERANTLIHESEARLRELATQAFDMLTLSREGIILRASGAVEAILGVKPDELVGKPILEFVAPSFRPMTRRILADQYVGKLENEVLHRNGECIPVEIVAISSTLEGEPVRVSGMRDLREKRRLAAERRVLEQQVERAQRLDSLGVLAGGIAHDFNNLLVGVLGGAEVLLQRLTDPVDRDAASTVLAAGKRAADLTRQMLAYAGQRDLGRREPVDLRDLWEEIQTLLGAGLSKKAHIELAIEPDSFVRGDRSMLMQVMMNLLTNASDALEDEPGRIEVRSQRVKTPDARWKAALGAKVEPGNWLLVEVRDTGSGMNEETLGRIFEPFFSMKKKGHGLGLAACLGIVSSHGGAILVESTPGKGSCFSMLLPAAPSAFSEPPRVPTVRPERPCRVLLIDDEPLVRKQLRTTLELCGYVVEEAASGRSGLAAAQTSSADILIVDMIMPDIDGVEVVRRIRAGGSRVPIIVSSGYLDPTVEQKLDPKSFQGFLPKPYVMTDLVETIDRALRTNAELSSKTSR
jgi:two-component system cell cycle sensor histidine kinase/response regulator CckA